MAGNKRRRSLAMMVVAVVAACLTALTGMPASANDVTGLTGTGTGSGGSSTVVYGGGADTSFQCHSDGSLWKNGREQYLPGYPNCVYIPAQITDGSAQCPAGALVYRFYGTKGGSVQAWSVSWVMFPAVLDPTTGRCWTTANKHDRNVNLFFPNPQDAGSPPSTSPWGSAQAGVNPTFRLPYAYSEKGYPTTGQPVKVVGDCAAVQPKDNPAAQAWAANYEDFRKHVVSAIAASPYRQYPNTWKRSYFNVSFTGTPTESNVSFGDGINCSSPADFSSWDATPANQQLEAGTCYIPINTHARIMVSGGRYYAAVKAADGLRVDPFAGDQTSQDKSHPEYKRWRALIAGDAGARVGAPFSGSPSGTAGTIAADYAHCAAAQSIVPVASLPKCPAGVKCQKVTQSQPPVSAAQMTLTLHDQDVFQVGGQMRPDAAGTVSVTAGPLVGVPSGARLVALSYHLQVAGTNGYAVCTAGPGGAAGAGCDASVQKLTTDTAPVQQTQQALVRAYRATMPDQKVLVEVTGASATYQWTTTTPVWTIVIDGVTFKMGGESVTRTATFTPTVVGAPLEVSPQVDGPGVQVPAIGAVSVPSP